MAVDEVWVELTREDVVVDDVVDVDEEVVVLVVGADVTGNNVWGVDVVVVVVVVLDVRGSVVVAARRQIASPWLIPALTCREQNTENVRRRRRRVPANMTASESAMLTPMLARLSNASKIVTHFIR